MSAKRIVMITGAAQGLGKGIAEAFAEVGDHVIVADINGEEAARTAAALKGEAVELDISSVQDVRTTVADIEARHGRIDVLVNNAGVVGGGGRSSSWILTF